MINMLPEPQRGVGWSGRRAPHKGALRVSDRGRAPVGMATSLLLLASGLAHAADLPTAYWRFEDGEASAPCLSAREEGSAASAVAGPSAPVFSDDVPMAVMPVGDAANHHSLNVRGGYLRVGASPTLDVSRNFTVEFWAKFGPPTDPGQVLASRGTPGPGNWHIIYQPDGTVRANIYGATETYLFDLNSGGPVIGVWYHLAAIYEDCGNGEMRIRAYVNGQPRDSRTGPMLQDTRTTDLFIGSYPEGQYPFQGSLDEFRFTPQVLTPHEFLLAGTRPIPEAARTEAAAFVAPGTQVTAGLREHLGDAPIVLRPDGYTYFYTRVCVGLPQRCAPPGAPYDRGFEGALVEHSVNKGGPPIGYHFAVRPGGRFVVAIGFFDPAAEPGKRVQHVVIDGRRVDLIDLAEAGGGKPFVRAYEVRDRDHDGFLEVTCFHEGEESGRSASMSVVWVFPDEAVAQLDTDQLARGECPVAPMYYVRCGREEELRGHVGYPPLRPEAKSRMLPMRPVLFDRDPNWPQPVDPLDIDVRGELAGRIRTYMDRWAYAGRDQGLVTDFLSDCGFETHGRFLETYSILSRLMHVDVALDHPTRALMARQDGHSLFPGSFVGGTPTRTGFIWSQGTILSGLMASYDRTGDPSILEAARRLAAWYRSYLDNGDLAAANYFADDGRFSREGATVGHLGKGALEGMVWLYWRTKDPAILETAMRMADLNRQWGGVAWMIHGEIPNDRPELESWHIHANLTTVRGFPWLYAATGDRSYLDDAIAACDRVFDRATWGTGGVLEQIPWARDPDPHDETCQTSDELQLSYLLADFTGEGRFFDRAEQIYYNHIRYMQYHQGDFSTFNRLPGPQRGGDGWFCCGWWGGKALYETARHLYASSPTGGYVNGFMPSAADLRLEGGPVHIETQADIPRSGDVRLTITPATPMEFTLKIRVPGWAEVVSVKVNGDAVHPEVHDGYTDISRRWRPGDEVHIRFRLPLRVALDDAFDSLPPAQVSVDGAPPVEARCVSVFQGPVILAQFRLAHGCDLNWVYTGDHPDLLDTLDSSADVVEANGWRFESDNAPALTEVRHTPEGVLLTWEQKPRPGWRLRSTTLVRPGVPVRVERRTELFAPSRKAAQDVTSVRLCGVRMKTRGFPDYRPATFAIGDHRVASAELIERQGDCLTTQKATLDNGYIQFGLDCTQPLSAAVDGSWTGLYAAPELHGRSWAAQCVLTATGQNQWEAPLIGGEVAARVE